MNYFFASIVLISASTIAYASRIPSDPSQVGTKVIKGEFLTENTEQQGDGDWVKITKNPPSVIEARLGQRVEVECEAYGRPYPEIKWLREDGSTVKFGNSRGISELTQIGSRLVIDCATMEDEGFYTCTALAGSKMISAKSTLISVQDTGRENLEACLSGQLQAPRIVSWTRYAFQMIGSPLMIPCTAVGNPVPRIYWIGYKTTNVVDDMNHKAAATGDLIIQKLAWSHMGDYTCVAENSEGIDEKVSYIYPVMNEQDAD